MATMEDFEYSEIKQVISIFEKIKGTSGKNDKQAILDNHKDNDLMCECLKFLLCNEITTGISESKMNKLILSTSTPYLPKTFSDLMKYLIANNTGKDADIRVVTKWIAEQPEEDRQWFYEMVTKTYRLGVDSKTVNKVIPNLIPAFDVQLGKPIDKVKIPEDAYIYISRKMNGTRVLCWGCEVAKTRSGKNYVGVNHILDDIHKLDLDDYAVDGELLYKNEEGLSDSEAFQKGTGIANSKAEKKPELKMVIFDLLPIKEFMNGKSEKPYSERKEMLLQVKQKIEDMNLKNVEIVPMVYEGNDHSQIWKWLDKCEKELDWEGVMINLDKPYECKRTGNLIKVKKFYDVSLRCTNVNIATTGKFKGKMGSVTCKFGGNTVDVGSGFDDYKRSFYAEHPEEIIGKIISIKYKEKTSDKNGNNSLQFPVFICIREDVNISDDEQEDVEIL